VRLLGAVSGMSFPRSCDSRENRGLIRDVIAFIHGIAPILQPNRQKTKLPLSQPKAKS
jgi:hypothetical protein